MIQGRRALVWTVIALLAAAVSYLGFRGYLSPEMLFNLANVFYC